MDTRSLQISAIENSFFINLLQNICYLFLFFFEKEIGFFPSREPNFFANIVVVLFFIEAKNANGGVWPVDLSKIRLRPGGVNYIYNLLTGYHYKSPYGIDIPKGKYFNPYFDHMIIGMPRVSLIFKHFMMIVVVLMAMKKCYIFFN